MDKFIKKSLLNSLKNKNSDPAWGQALVGLRADVLAGSIITKPAAVLEAVARDLPFYQIKKQGVRLATWVRPGLDLGLQAGPVTRRGANMRV